MTLSAGTRLGPYEILAPLGAGGMGEVYRARDSRLEREVAIKVLPAALASDPERLKRFEREARAASSLNHPNIVTIYDIGSEGGVSYIAMELVKGEPLRAELVGGDALPVRQVLQIGTQIAEGLAKAHAAGIVHRDLKPENVMVTEDDHVKILDFGLAKLTQPDSSGGQATIAPTVSGATQEGVILGTVGYMSPEQAAGLPVDYRSDQFSLGSMLYEMATGRRAFQRASVPQTLTAIIQDEPEPIAAINPRIPAPVRWIVERCLGKEPRRRFASTEDLASDLATVRDRLAEATSGAGLVAEPSAAVHSQSRWLPAGIAAAILIAGAIAIWRLRHSDSLWKNPLAEARFTRLTDWEGSEVDAAISSDGKFVSFLSDRDGIYDAWVTQVGSDEFVNLSKGRFPELYFQQIRNVGFAGDGTHVWVRVLEKSKANTSDAWLVPTMGGNPRPFIAGAISLAWSPDGDRILYHTAADGDPIFVADRSGSNPKQIFVSARGIHNHYPIWSPDGRFIYFVRGIPSPFDMDLWRVRAGGGNPERLTSVHGQVAYPAFLNDHTLLYTAPRSDGSGSSLYALDTERRTSHVLSFGLEEYVSIAATPDGRRLVVTLANPESHLWAAPISDRIVEDSGVGRFALPAVRASSARFGPDYILFLSSRGGTAGLWRFKDGIDTELWNGAGGSIMAAPAISPDGTRIAFVVRDRDRGRLNVMTSDGTDVRRVNDSLDVRDAPTWSRDGGWIAVVATEGNEQPLFKVPLGGGAPIRLMGGVNYDPVWSPDGRFIVYSEHHGGPTVELKAVTPDGAPFSISKIEVRSGANRYRFLPDGKSLVVMRGESRHQDYWLLDLASGQIRQLTKLRGEFFMTGFDVSPDGKTILFDRYRQNSDIVLIDLPSRR